MAAVAAAGPTVFFLLATIIFKRSAEQESLAQGEEEVLKLQQLSLIFFFQGGLALSLYVSVYSTLIGQYRVAVGCCCCMTGRETFSVRKRDTLSFLFRFFSSSLERMEQFCFSSSGCWDPLRSVPLRRQPSLFFFFYFFDLRNDGIISKGKGNFLGFHVAQ